MTDENKKDEVEKEDLTDWVQQRGKEPGRRKTDNAQCAMHDYLVNKNDHCFDIIKNTIKEEVRKRDHKFEVLESRLENFISKWALGIIILICLTLLGGMFTFASWQVKELGIDISKIKEKMVEINLVSVNSLASINLKVSEIAVKQNAIKIEIEKLMPEHEELMKHLILEKKERK